MPSSSPSLIMASIIALASAALIPAMAGAADDKTLEPTATGKKTGLIPREVLFGNPEKASPQIRCRWATS